MDHQLLLDHSKRWCCLKHLGRGKKEDMKRLVSNSSLLSDDNCSSCSTTISSSKNSLIRRSPKKNFSRVIKAVFFETIMLKRVRDGKGRQCQEHSNANKVLINTDHQVNEADLARSCSSSISEPRKLSEIKKSSKNPNQGLEFKARNMDKSGIFLLLMSLTVMILWGKLCAIICNLIWLYFLARNGMILAGLKMLEQACGCSTEKKVKRSVLQQEEGHKVKISTRVNGIKFLA